MNVQDIINAVADDADGFLNGVSSMTEARPAIREYLKSNYPKLPSTDEALAIAGVLAILDEEGFFEAEAGGDGAEESGAGSPLTG